MILWASESESGDHNAPALIAGPCAQISTTTRNNDDDPIQKPFVGRGKEIIRLLIIKFEQRGF